MDEDGSEKLPAKYYWLIVFRLGESLCRTLAVGHMTRDPHVSLRHSEVVSCPSNTLRHADGGTETNSDSEKSDSEGDGYNYNRTRTDTHNNGSHDYASEHKPEHEYKHRPGVDREFTLREINTRVADGKWKLELNLTVGARRDLRLGTWFMTSKMMIPTMRLL